MKTSIAVKVISVYLVIVMGSLILAGVLTNRAIETYVIDMTRASLVKYGKGIITRFEDAGRGAAGANGKGPPGAKASLTVAAQTITPKYIVVDPTGAILWNTFSKTDHPLLSKVSGVVVKALQGDVAVGVYPHNNPVFEFVAIPFHYASRPPLEAVRPGSSDVLLLPQMKNPHVDTKVVALFARVSDMQRITSEIWRAVVQGLVISSLITALVGLLLVRRLMRPVGIIKTAIDRVRQRDFSAVPVVNTGDEWEEFANAFGDMVQALQAFDEGQKRFLQNASHELKTPLMGIRGYAEGLRDGVFKPSESSRILDIIAQESVRLKSLVDELIYLSKLETLDEVYTFVQYDVSLIIYKTIERVHPLAKDRGILILPDVPEEPLYALVDQDKMVQALLNLAANAVRHAHHQIFIRLAAKDAVELIVEDDGDGFRDQDKERVFERFFHGAKGDTGLGLPIAKAIIEKHKGQIIAEDAEGGGARFVIQLPR
ncbi:MAG: HAMP domain-containing sensor histidine kinase [Bacilli bacterium]